MKKTILGLALLGSVAFANISSPIVINNDDAYIKFYEKLIYKVDRTPVDNYLVGIYLTVKDFAKILYKLKGETLLAKSELELQTNEVKDLIN